MGCQAGQAPRRQEDRIRLLQRRCLREVVLHTFAHRRRAHLQTLRGACTTPDHPARACAFLPLAGLLCFIVFVPTVPGDALAASWTLRLLRVRSSAFGRGVCCLLRIASRLLSPPPCCSRRRCPLPFRPCSH